MSSHGTRCMWHGHPIHCQRAVLKKQEQCAGATRTFCVAAAAAAASRTATMSMAPAPPLLKPAARLRTLACKCHERTHTRLVSHTRLPHSTHIGAHTCLGLRVFQRARSLPERTTSMCVCVSTCSVPSSVCAPHTCFAAPTDDLTVRVRV